MFAFGDVGRIWFGGVAGLKPYVRGDLDADAQSLLARTVDALRRDSFSFFGWRGLKSAGASREDFEKLERTERTLSRTVQSRRDLTAALLDAADRLGPRLTDATATFTDLFSPPPDLSPFSGWTAPPSQ